ncbi:MAG: aspartate kinase [Candidatus Acidiferrum sp.]
MKVAASGKRDDLRLMFNKYSFELGASVLKRARILREDLFRSASDRRRTDRPGKRPLRVMKFGGTSVGDVPSIEKVVEIIRAAALETHVVVVVSAMSGVTNRLIEAATRSEGGDYQQVAAIFEDLRNHHGAAFKALIRSAAERTCFERKMQELLEEGDKLCQDTILRRELTLQARDSISSLGERLSALLVAAALSERGVVSEAIDASGIVVTNSDHGDAEPRMDLTRVRCEARLRPLLQRGAVPVVTGFIGATTEGALTTLGRGGSDYSATILGAALGADEVIIWTDVDGLLTADPRLVPGVRTIPEISYRQATELAYFGAKVLHPKTLRPLVRSGIPLWIRNTFAPDRPGTRVTPLGPANGGGVKALTALSDVALITVSGPGIMGLPDVFSRTFATTATVRAEVLLISRSSSQNDIRFAVPAAIANRTVEALHREFARDVARKKVEHTSVATDVAIVTVVGQHAQRSSAVVGRVLGALGREEVDIVAIARDSSEGNISFAVAQKDMRAALIAMHQEFQLGIHAS